MDTQASAAPRPAARGPWLWLVAPPVAVLLLRAFLRQGAVDMDELQRLRVAQLVSDPSQAFWLAARPFVLGLVAVVLLVLALYFGLRTALRRHGWRGVQPWVTAAWVLVWLLLGAWWLAEHLNRSGRQSLPEQSVRVLLARELAPGTRRPGGTEVYFQSTEAPAPERLLAPWQPLAGFPVGSVVTLRPETGRWWGRWGHLQAAAHR